MKRVALITFGCKVNQYESSCILDDFLARGYESVAYEETAEVYVINTCTVTNRTDYKARNAIRKALARKTLNPEVKVVVTGCYAQLNRDKIEDMGELDLIVDNNHKDMISDYLDNLETNKFVDDSSQFSLFTEQKTTTLFDRVRAFIKIQDGCDYFCSYCTIPYARGKPRSRDLKDILEQTETFLEQGYREIVLTGINLGLYGKDFANDSNLLTLLQELEKLTELERVRLSSIEPQLITPELLEFLATSKKLTPHLHIPLQSGSDSVLKEMKRPYTSAQFALLIRELLSSIPDLAIGTDIIVGFPTETEQYFEESYAFLEGLPLVYAHIFPFSPRPGTVGAQMESKSSPDIVRQRCNQLKQLFNHKKEGYLDYLIKENITLNGVVEKNSGKYATALSDHYIRIYHRSDILQKGDLMSGKAVRKVLSGIEVITDD